VPRIPLRYSKALRFTWSPIARSGPPPRLISANRRQDPQSGFDVMCARRWLPFRLGAKGLTLSPIMPASRRSMTAELMFLRHGQTDIDRRQNHKDVGLQKRNKEVQGHEERRNHDGHQSAKYFLDQIAHQHIRPETDAQ